MNRRGFGCHLRRSGAYLVQQNVTCRFRNLDPQKARYWCGYPNVWCGIDEMLFDHSRLRLRAVADLPAKGISISIKSPRVILDSELELREVCATHRAPVASNLVDV